MQGDSPYEVLGVSPDADYETIKTAYRNLAKETHPDVNKEPDAEERFKQISAAWDLLSDPVKKGRFDNLSRSRRGPKVTMSNFEDVLRRSGFPGFSGPSERPRPGGRKGQNIVHTLLVSPLEIILGETVEAHFNRAVPCPICNGKGADLERCDICGGTGSISQEMRQEHFQQIVTFPCPKCQSHGWVKNNPCGHCNGEGLVQEEQKEEVSLTGLSGDIQGATKIVYGVGHYGPFGGSPGDLLIQIVPLFPPAERLNDEVISLLKSAYSLMK